MKLTFDAQTVERLIEMTEALRVGVSSYSAVGACVAGPRQRGLHLVGDQGVYVMSNAENQPRLPGSDRLSVCFADQVNPFEMEFDDWWEAKQASFGSDDGTEFIPIDEAKRWLAGASKGKCVLDLSSTEWVPGSARLRDVQGAWRYRWMRGLRPARFDEQPVGATQANHSQNLAVVK